MAGCPIPNGPELLPVMRHLASLFCGFLLLSSGCHRKQQQLCLLSDPDAYMAFRVGWYFGHEANVKLNQFEYHDDSGATSLARLTEEQAHPEVKTYHPPVDVYWGGDPVYAEILKQRGLTIPYRVSSRIPAKYRDSEGYWTGIAARTRVFLVRNSLRRTERPKSILAYADPEFYGKGVLPDPLVGGTRSHFAALAALWGEQKLASFYSDLLKNGTRIIKSEAESADLVAAGKADFALVGSDIALNRLQRDHTTDIIYPDQEQRELGIMVIPNVVTIMKGCRNINAARKLVDFMTSLEGERRIISFAQAQVPLQVGIGTSSVNTWRLEELHTMPISYTAVSKFILNMEKILPAAQAAN